MALRLASKLKSINEKSVNGFTLNITSNGTYNLDEIIKNISRSNINALSIEVKKHEEINKKVIEQIVDNISIVIEGIYKSDEYKKLVSDIKDKIRNVIENLYLTYGEDYIYDVIKEKIAYEFSEFFSKRLNLVYTIDKSDITIQIDSSNLPLVDVEENYQRLKKFEFDANINFYADDILTQAIERYYGAIYLNLYKKELYDIEVGGLAISDKKEKRTITTSDCMMYLFDENTKKRKYSNNKDREIVVSTVINNSSSKNNTTVYWEDGTQES